MAPVWPSSESGTEKKGGNRILFLSRTFSSLTEDGYPGSYTLPSTIYP